MAETVLDLRGLKFPLPALKARKALSRLTAADARVLECTDPLAMIDIPNLVRETGDALEPSARERALFVGRSRQAGRRSAGMTGERLARPPRMTAEYWMTAGDYL